MTHVNSQSLVADFVAENPGDEDAVELKRRMLAGQQVPDNLANALIAARLARKDANELGTVIDGFPATEGQLAYFSQTLNLTPAVVFMLECSDSHVLGQQQFVDPLTGVALTLDQAKATDDHALLHRISLQAQEIENAIQNNLEHWELTRRSLVKHFDTKTISVQIENKTENQILEHLAQILRKKI